MKSIWSNLLLTIFSLNRLFVKNLWIRKRIDSYWLFFAKTKRHGSINWWRSTYQIFYGRLLLADILCCIGRSKGPLTKKCETIAQDFYQNNQIPFNKIELRMTTYILAVTILRFRKGQSIPTDSLEMAPFLADEDLQLFQQLTDQNTPIFNHLAEELSEHFFLQKRKIVTARICVVVLIRFYWKESPVIFDRSLERSFHVFARSPGRQCNEMSPSGDA